MKLLIATIILVCSATQLKAKHIEFRLNRFGGITIETTAGQEYVRIYQGDKQSEDTVFESRLRQVVTEVYSTPGGTLLVLKHFATPVINDGNRHLNSGDWQITISGDAEFENLKNKLPYVAFGNQATFTYYGEEMTNVSTEPQGRPLTGASEAKFPHPSLSSDITEAPKQGKKGGDSTPPGWVILLGLFVVGGGLLLMNEFEKQNARRAQEAELARQKQAQLAAYEGAIMNNMQQVITQSEELARQLPQLIQTADNALNLAESEYKEGVFAPFWDAVEKAVNALANYNIVIQQLSTNATWYKRESSRLTVPPQAFQFGIRLMPDAAFTTNRMRVIVRCAQKDFHFATIYEQRKTNQLLVSGFTSLGQAIYELGDRLNESINTLSSEVTVAIDTHKSSQRDNLALLEEELRLSRLETIDRAEERRSHEEQQREMLDNIQRRRKPRLPQ